MLVLLSLLSVLFSCLAGSTDLAWQTLPAALVEWLCAKPLSLDAMILQLRLQRVAAAFLTGGSLALAGVMMQALLRNPLADPYVLGVSGGASVGVLLALLLGGAAWMTDAAALGGAMIVAILLYWLVHRAWEKEAGAGGMAQLLLTGVMLAFGCGALVTLLLSVAPNGYLRGMVFWLVGDLEGARLNGLSVLVLLAVLAGMMRLARSVNLLAWYAGEAAALGVNIGGLRRFLFTGGALLTACAVANAGNLGFVGLIVPHFCRRLFGPDHRLLLPAATLAGGMFLVFADMLARTVMSPRQLPVGAVMALIGVPIFLWQLYGFKDS